MFYNYDIFIVESEKNDLLITDLFSSLESNYESTRNFFTDLKQYILIGEVRDWEPTREDVELSKLKYRKGIYSLKYKLNERLFEIKINFSFRFSGKNNRDDTSLDNGKDYVLSIVLEEINIERIFVKSKEINFNSSNFSKSIENAVTRLLIKILYNDYDILGNKLISLEH